MLVIILGCKITKKNPISTIMASVNAIIAYKSPPM